MPPLEWRLSWELSAGTLFLSSDRGEARLSRTKLGLLKGATVLPIWSKGTLRVRDIAKWASSHRVMEIK